MKRLIPAFLFAAGTLAATADTPAAPSAAIAPAAQNAAPVAGPTQQSLDKLAELAHVGLIHDAMLGQLNKAIDSGVAQAIHGEAQPGFHRAQRNAPFC